MFSAIPDILKLSIPEWRMLSPRLCFMKIREAAAGKQLKIHGNAVNVPSDVATVVGCLPRTSSDNESVAIQLKRRSQYSHTFMSANIRPA
jgi:hypothetical protein